MRRPPRSLVWMTVFAIAVAAVLATAPRVAAAQNAPAWTQGDFWVYARTGGSATSTVRIDVNERTTLTLPSRTYNVWHLTTTTTDAGGNSTVQHSWVVDSNLATAKANFTLPPPGRGPSHARSAPGRSRVPADRGSPVVAEHHASRGRHLLQPQHRVQRHGPPGAIDVGRRGDLQRRGHPQSVDRHGAQRGPIFRRRGELREAGIVRRQRKPRGRPGTDVVPVPVRILRTVAHHRLRRRYCGGRDCPIHRRAPAEARVDAAATRNRPAADATASVGAQALHRPGPRDRACEADPTPRSRWRSSPSRSHRFSSRGATRLRSRSLCTGSPSPRGSSERRS